MLLPTTLLPVTDMEVSLQLGQYLIVEQLLRWVRREREEGRREEIAGIVRQTARRREIRQQREKETQFNNSTTDETQPLTLIYSRELAVHAKKEGAITEDNRRPTQVLFIQNQTPTALDNAAYNHHTTHLLVHTY